MPEYIPSLSVVLFDMDDTLVNSFAARSKALSQVFARAGITTPSAEEFLRNLQGRQLKEALLQLAAEKEPETDLFGDYRLSYWTKEPGAISLYPGVKVVLEELQRRSVKLGVVTQKGRAFEVGGRHAGALQELDELGIGSLFSVVVGFEDVSCHKPDPSGVHLALGQLGAQPEETLLVGDAPADIEAAKAAGCWSCYATWGIEQQGIDVQADIVARTPHSLLELGYL